MLSQFFVLSPRGDTIIRRDFRKEMTKETNEFFFRKVKFWKGDAPPIFNLDGINYIYIKRSGMYFVVTTMYNSSPAYSLEILERLAKIIKDFCGILSEEAIRKNFVLIYEIIDEVIDCGHPQLMSSEQIKPFIVNEPIVLASQKPATKRTIFKPSIFTASTIPSTAVQRPMAASKKNEIFVDIFEKLTILFNSNGYVINSAIDGCIQMKSYLKGNPELKLILNDDLVIGRQNVSSAINAVVLDDCNFHEVVNTKDFDTSRTLTIIPPDGEFVVMNYRITGEFQAPFRIYPFIDELSNYKLQLILKIRACFPEDHYASQVLIKFPVPRTSTSVNFELPKNPTGQNTEYKTGTKTVDWFIKKMQGGAEYTLITKINLEGNNASACRKEIGPINMKFEIPMYNVSNLLVKHLRIAEKKGYNPFRWVRYVTQASSYVCRT